MNITPNKFTIAQLFASQNEQFLVPSYQRRYAWKYNQVAALYDDINMLKDNDGHLFGMIILHTNFHTGGINQPELVDGQQRMTTLVLFLKAFEDVYRLKGKEEKANDIRKMIRCKDLNDIEKPKLILGDLDNKDILQLIMHNRTEEITNTKIKDAYDWFFEWLEELEIEDINKLFYKLTNVAVIIRLDVAMAQDAFKLFETINNRGLRLTPTDIIKNFLLGHAAKINSQETLEEVKRLWSKIILNLDEIDTDDFLRQLICSIYYRKITMSNLVYDFKDYYFKNVEKADLLGEFEYFQDEIEDDEDDSDNTQHKIENSENTKEINSKTPPKYTIISFLIYIEERSQIYRKLALGVHENQKINRKIINLNRILSKSSYIFLMNFLIEGNYSAHDTLKVLDFIETLMLRRHTCESRTSENDDIFSKFVPFIGTENILGRMKTYVEDNEFIPDNSDFEESLPKYQFKGKLIDRAKYILETIEYFKRGNTSELMLTSHDEVHLEHIIPQTIDTKRSKLEFGDWVSYLGDKSVVKHKKYVNYIGNMTLLGESLNIQAYNNPFAKKKGSYKKSNFKITNELQSLNDFKFSHVDKRGEELTRLALQIWKI